MTNLLRILKFLLYILNLPGVIIPNLMRHRVKYSLRLNSAEHYVNHMESPKQSPRSILRLPPELVLWVAFYKSPIPIVDKVPKVIDQMCHHQNDDCKNSQSDFKLSELFHHLLEYISIRKYFLLRILFLIFDSLGV